jgi:signal transduction histidine kinase
LGKLTAGIAHEIKNPLNFVNNFAQLSGELVEEIETDVVKCKSRVDPDTFEDITANLDSLKFNVAKINEHGERADNIVKSMLQHAREKSDKKTPVNINKLVDEFVGLAYHGQRAKDSSFTVDIEKRLDESIGEVEVFAQDLGRVILNVAGNAFYANRKG